jgi:transposase, IS5 family
MGGQIVDASLVAAPKQRNTEDEKKAIKEGRIPDKWKAKPAKPRHKDRDARWTVKFSKARPREDGTKPAVDLAVPVFGYHNYLAIDRSFGPIRRWDASDAAAYEGARLRGGLLDKTNTTSRLGRHGLSLEGQRGIPGQERLPQPHPSQETARPPYATDDAAGQRAEIESPSPGRALFAVQKDKMDLFIRTVGMARATMKIGMANIVYNMKRLVFLNRIAAA